MADSDNSRTLPPVTRGDFHSFVVASLPTYPELSDSISTSPDDCDDDPAFRIWREWCVARQQLIESCVRQQRLETQLFSMVGSPLDAPEAWEAADKEIGYSEALEEEGRALDVENGVAPTLWDAPASSVAGAIAKLHAVVNKWQPSATSDEYPWPQIRSVMADLLRIDAEMSRRGNRPYQISASETRREFQDG
ncbi:hypothetical protein [Rhizobium sp. P28RR-XV]|uniref:hypothetical protein n=1 Tax=Rhizobium sp. P28RR-XV TaxID=2726737 RepID=UPI001456DFC8|nr:hypothetical protein [Rhizobium sp. P28RR-XV]NLR85462.1 hypothetical protein [Rhizobium sp. P28RR-XV]